MQQTNIFISKTKVLQRLVAWRRQSQALAFPFCRSVVDSWFTCVLCARWCSVIIATLMHTGNRIHSFMYSFTHSTIYSLHHWCVCCSFRFSSASMFGLFVKAGSDAPWRYVIMSIMASVRYFFVSPFAFLLFNFVARFCFLWKIFN